MRLYSIVQTVMEFRFLRLIVYWIKIENSCGSWNEYFSFHKKMGIALLLKLCLFVSTCIHCLEFQIKKEKKKEKEI